MAYSKQILVYSFETGNEVTLKGGKRLSAHTRGGGGSSKTAAPGAAAIVAADVASDNGTLAVACAGSGNICKYELQVFLPYTPILTPVFGA